MTVAILSRPATISSLTGRDSGLSIGHFPPSKAISSRQTGIFSPSASNFSLQMGQQVTEDARIETKEEGDGMIRNEMSLEMLKAYIERLVEDDGLSNDT